MVRRLFAGSFGFAASTTTLTQLLSTAPLPVIFSFATTTTATEVSARKGAKANAASSLAAGTTSTTATTEQTGKVEDADKYRPVLHRRRRHGRAHRKGRRLARAARQMPLKQHLNTHTFHHMVNKGRRARKRSRTPSLDLMKMLAARDVLDSRHPALHEIVKVARELADSRDEELASATVPVLEDSLEKLQVLTATSAERAKDPGAGDFIADMRAQVCAQKKDTEREKCQAFMDGYCARADKAGGAACKAFMGGEEEEETEEAEEAVEEEEPKKPDVVEEDEDLTKDGADDASTPLIEEDEGEQPKKPKGPPPKELPAQGFEGEGVAHIDGETQTDDWREEFGPGQPDTYSSVCAEHPDNEWCRLHGYYTPKADAAGKHASSTALAVVTAVGSVALGAAGGFLW